MKKRFAIQLAIVCTMLAVSATGQAFEIETESDWNMQLNGYLDMEYTFMSRMPMFMNMSMGMDGMYMDMDAGHELAQKHINLLFDAENGLFRWHLNLESLTSLTTERQDWERQHLLEGYGEYTFDDSLRLRVGKFLAPFGIYNDVRYITPLYATVVLPFMYETSRNYSGTPLTPPPAVAMLSGQYWGDDWDLYYAFYMGTEDKTEQGINKRDVGESFGGRVRATMSEVLSLGFSAYTAKDQSTRSFRTSPKIESAAVESPREFTWGADMEYKFPDDVTLQTEVARSNHENMGSRLSYYVRLQKEIGSWTPFVTI